MNNFYLSIKYKNHTILANNGIILFTMALNSNSLNKNIYASIASLPEIPFTEDLERLLLGNYNIKIIFFIKPSNTKDSQEIINKMNIENKNCAIVYITLEKLISDLMYTREKMYGVDYVVGPQDELIFSLDCPNMDKSAALLPDAERELEINKEFTILDLLLQKSVFISDGYSWDEIVSQFKNNKFYISGGLSTKRHIISSVQRRLCRVLDFLQIPDKFSIATYHNNPELKTNKSHYSNYKNNKNKSSIPPFIIGKRFLHNASIMSSVPVVYNPSLNIYKTSLSEIYLSHIEEK